MKDEKIRAPLHPSSLILAEGEASAHPYSMISALTGNLVKVHDASIDLQSGPFLFSLLVPAIDVEPLRSQVNRELTFHTIFYLEGSASGGNLDPKLIGFLRPDDRAFFDLFTTVKGIGPKTALRALTEPIGTIAAWIEGRDARSLTKLSGIGKRTAELVIAELAGKCAKFAGSLAGAASAARSPVQTNSKSFTPDQEDAIRALVSLGERRLDAENLLDRVLRASPKLTDANEIVTEMLRQRG
jgi:Holliday junction DNA helicase RuvA